MPNFRYLTLICLALSVSGHAYAKKPETSPIKQFQSHKSLKKSESNYLTHRNDISMADLQELDQQLLSTYGQPTAQRGQLKIWEIPNPENGFGQSDKVTIMCGINPDGSKAFIIDARAPLPATSTASPPKSRGAIVSSNARNKQVNPNIQD